MKTKDKWHLSIDAMLGVSAAIGPKRYLQVQKDRGQYHYGFHRGEIDGISRAQTASATDPILRDEHARHLDEKGYAGLSQAPPRYASARGSLHLMKPSDSVSP